MVIYLQTKNLFTTITIFLCLIIVYSASYYFTFLRFKDEDYTENNALLIENYNLKKEINNLEEALNLEKENESYIITKVINRNLYNFYNEITINTKNIDIKEGTPIINHEGLIGIVDKTEGDISHVKLLTGKYNISVKVNNTYGNLNNGIITLLDKYEEINIGDKVYTSGLTNIAENIYIGEIESVSLNKDETAKEATVKLIDNNNLNYVAIMRLRWFTLIL